VFLDRAADIPFEFLPAPNVNRTHYGTGLDPVGTREMKDLIVFLNRPGLKGLFFLHNKWMLAAESLPAFTSKRIYQQVIDTIHQFV